MVNIRAFILIFLGASILSFIYYQYVQEEMRGALDKSDYTMLQTDGMRFSFKGAILLQKSQRTYRVAVDEQDEDLLYDALDYFEAANGFLQTNFIENKELLKKIKPYFNEIEHIMNSAELHATQTQIHTINKDIDSSLKLIELKEKDIWAEYQQKYVKFKTNEALIYTLYEIIILIGTVLLSLFMWMLIKQKKLNNTILQREDELLELAYFDVLTKIPNRQSIENIISDNIEKSKRGKSDFYLALIDIDNFKNINDLHGHDIGDLVLRECVKNLKQSVRNLDVIGRFGGDEFIIIFRDIASINDLTIILDRILNSFKNPIEIESEIYYTNVSIGLSKYPSQAKNASELIKNADIAMYRSKELGKARYNFFETAQAEIIQRKYKLEPEIQKGIRENQFELHYQPQIDTFTQEVVGVEALTRWNHPLRGKVSPVEFIDIIENGYLVKDFGRWVIKEAAREHALLKSKDIHINMSVNLSVKYILSHGFFEDITTLVSELDIDLKTFHFEITEYNIMSHYADSSHVINRLSEEGFIFSLDDFGTGYSSITNLYNMQINSLKIDKSFVDEIDVESENCALVDAIVNMAKALQLKIIAEGVETEGQYRYLRDLECDIIQGYYFAKPMPASELYQYVIQSKQ